MSFRILDLNGPNSFYHFQIVFFTLNRKTQSTIINLLSLVNPEKIVISPERKNLRISVTKCKKTEMFGKLDWLTAKEKGVDMPKTIIFCNMMNDMACVCNYLLFKLGKYAYNPTSSRDAKDCIVDVYHSMTWADSKERLLASFKGSLEDDIKRRIVIASTALSMGVNFPDVRYVINWGPARTLLDYHQEAGRAGRDGKQAHSISLPWQPVCSL